MCQCQRKKAMTWGPGPNKSDLQASQGGNSEFICHSLTRSAQSKPQVLNAPRRCGFGKAMFGLGLGLGLGFSNPAHIPYCTWHKPCTSSHDARGTMVFTLRNHGRKHPVQGSQRGRRRERDKPNLGWPPPAIPFGVGVGWGQRTHNGRHFDQNHLARPLAQPPHDSDQSAAPSTAESAAQCNLKCVHARVSVAVHSGWKKA